MSGRGHWTPADLHRLGARAQKRVERWMTQAEPTTPERPMKYGNQPVEADGERFDSRWEHECWVRLCLRERAGEIHDTRRQVPYELHVGPQTIGRIVVDFTWRDEEGCLHVADAKGGHATETPLFRWKRKHFESEYGTGIEILRRAT